ncbi:MAG: hypothetical protein COV47_06215 [Candidatus Diapherotrites archaeon CG11_big_fil_rev_8_21_14_0_20_37_9]|nr:MAG: hypothetical protein COV47_06215 [Candidatus Diapherotrites archaeon CG11_big_fil_rev_8_21_14_0_20_37_9]
MAPLFYIANFENKKIMLKEFGLEKIPPEKGIITAIKIVAALFIYSALFSFILALIGFNDLGKMENLIKSAYTFSPIYFAITITIGLFLEEYFFRAFLVPRADIWGSSIIFGIFHYSSGSIAQVIGATFLGLILAVAYKQYKNLIPLYIAHVLYDVIIIYFLVIR